MVRRKTVNDDDVEVVDDVESRDQEGDEVVWVYEPPDAAHEGASLHGIPRGDLTARTIAERGIDEDLLEQSSLYRRA